VSAACHADLFGLRQVLLYMRGYAHIGFKTPSLGFLLAFWATPFISTPGFVGSI